MKKLLYIALLIIPMALFGQNKILMYNGRLLMFNNKILGVDTIDHPEVQHISCDSILPCDFILPCDLEISKNNYYIVNYYFEIKYYKHEEMI